MASAIIPGKIYSSFVCATEIGYQKWTTTHTFSSLCNVHIRLFKLCYLYAIRVSGDRELNPEPIDYKVKVRGVWLINLVCNNLTLN